MTSSANCLLLIGVSMIFGCSVDASKTQAAPGPESSVANVDGGSPPADKSDTPSNLTDAGSGHDAGADSGTVNSTYRAGLQYNGSIGFEQRKP